MIDKNQTYSLGEIVRMKFLPGIDTIPKASRLVNNPIARKVLKARATPRGERGIQYRVKGENIINFLSHKNGKSRQRVAKKS